ncbi:MAG: hypothetical protein ABL885_08025 [Methylophilaceae bacterium]
MPCGFSSAWYSWLAYWLPDRNAELIPLLVAVARLRADVSNIGSPRLIQLRRIKLSVMTLPAETGIGVSCSCAAIATRVAAVAETG